ncbi:MAG: ATP-binding protein [Alphaproteobacteria bacterium GM7ARS4]|nr:ATP-binding protein [Alphaproteobacteria bacterium GM7ARS4]
MRATLFSQASGDTKGLKQLIDHCHHFCLCYGMSLRDMSHVLVICDEIASNIVHHGYHGHKRPCLAVITLTMSMRDCFLRICFEDNAPPFNPLRHNPCKPANEKGGFGLSLVKAFVHRMHYYRDGGHNILTMIKRLDVLPVNGEKSVARS